MAKLAVKTNKKLLKNNVFLKRSYDGYMQYGMLELIDKRDNHTNVIGKIKNNLIQEDVIIPYDSEMEKFKILEIIPQEFYYRVNMDQQRIYISFKKEAIKAHSFINKEYVNGFYKFFTCFDEEVDITLNVTLRTPELTEKIMKLRKDVIKVKKEFYPSRFLTIEDAKKDVKTYLLYLMENYEIDIIEDDLNEYLANMRKYYNNSDIDMFEGLLKEGLDGFSFRFLYQGKEYKVTVGSRKTDTYFEDYDGFNDVYKELISEK